MDMSEITILNTAGTDGQLSFGADGFPIDKKDTDEIEYEILDRANTMIRAPYHSSVLISKLIFLGLLKLQQDIKKNQYTGNWVHFPVAKIQKQTKFKDKHYLYKKLKEVSEDIIHSWFYIEDAEKKKFQVSVMVTDVKYEKGDFAMKFNDTAINFIENLTGNYTSMRRSILMDFSNDAKGNFAYRLYEILYTYIYRVNERQPKFFIEIPISKLIILLGLIDLNDKNIKRAMEKGMNEDYIVYELAGYNPSWTDLKRRYLEPAKEEINKITDINTNFKPRKVGRGSKVVSVIFCLERNDNYKKEQNITEAEVPEPTLDMIISLEAIIEEKLGTQDKVRILKAAGNDFERIEKAYKLAKSQKHITNLTAWLVKCLKEGWENNVPVSIVNGYTIDDAFSSLFDNEFEEDIKSEGINYAAFLAEKEALEMNNESNQEELNDIWEKLDD